MTSLEFDILFFACSERYGISEMDCRVIDGLAAKDFVPVVPNVAFCVLQIIRVNYGESISVGIGDLTITLRHRFV